MIPSTPSPPSNKQGFTLIELMIVVAIIGILVAIAIPKFADLLRKAHEGATKGNLGALRTAISIYYADNEGQYPTDDLSCLTSNQKYLDSIPKAHVATYHDSTSIVENNDLLGFALIFSVDDGRWIYWNWQDSGGTNGNWGDIWVGCVHTDSKGALWTSY